MPHPSCGKTASNDRGKTASNVAMVPSATVCIQETCSVPLWLIRWIWNDYHLWVGDDWWPLSASYRLKREQDWFQRNKQESWCYTPLILFPYYSDTYWCYGGVKPLKLLGLRSGCFWIEFWECYSQARLFFSLFFFFLKRTTSICKGNYLEFKISFQIKSSEDLSSDTKIIELWLMSSIQSPFRIWR